MILKEPIKLRGEFSLESTEAKWVRSMRDNGQMSEKEIVDAWLGQAKDSPEAGKLRVSYYLGNASAEEILRYLSPKEPSSIEFHAKVSNGYWLKTLGDDAEFNVLLQTPNLSIEQVHSLINNHQKSLCWLAYKNSHSGNAYPHQLDDGSIATPIRPEDIQILL